MKEYKLKDYNFKENNDNFKNYKINYEAELNKAQLEAVTTKNGPVLVIAGAGTGKTKTLVYRAARLVEEKINPENILLLTFTKKAALNMLKRASAILDERCSKISGGTFHSFASSLLRRYARFIGFSENFVIIDENDAENAIGIIRAKLGFNKTEKRFPSKHTIAEVISKSVNKNISIEHVLNSDYPHFIDNVEEIKLIQIEYIRYKKEKMLMDYDDLLLYLKELLTKNDDIRKKISNFYKYIMIDEYQDTNKIQADLAYLLASEHNNLMVVGDDSQSIYSFRGANFENMMDFPKKYPNCKIITLEQNYRSTQPILDFTNAIIENAVQKYSKKLFSEIKGDIKPAYIETDDSFMQSKFVVQRVLELREEGVPLNKIAVLFRNAWHSNDLEIELKSANIKYVKYGGIKFTESAHIKDIISYLKISYNPLDAISWFRVLQLIEGIGEKTAEFIIEEVVENKKGIRFLKDLVLLEKDINLDISDKIKMTDKNNKDNANIQYEEKLEKNNNYNNQNFKNNFKEFNFNLPRIKNYKKSYKNLYKLFLLFESISSSNLTPFEMLQMVFDYYKPIFESKYDDFNKRFQDIESLFLISQRYKKISSFISDMSIEPIEENQYKTEQEDKDDEVLVLSTIHSAKGLEWHTVFLIYLIDGFIPSTMSLSSLEEIEEERRLLYVAATRAKQNLYLIKPNYSKLGGNYFQTSYSALSEVSRFLKENNILEKYTEKWVLSKE